MRAPRQYEPIWIALKKDKYCRVSAHRGVHRRIIKAVKKEKNLDLGYKYQMHEQSLRAELEMKTSNNMIEFKLLHIEIISLEGL